VTKGKNKYTRIFRMFRIKTLDLVFLRELFIYPDYPEYPC